MNKSFTLGNVVTLLVSIGILSFSCQKKCDPDKLLKDLHELSVIPAYAFSDGFPSGL